MFNVQAIQFDKCDGLQITGLTHTNGPGPHIAVTDSNDVNISSIHINSPKESHNTDGIDLTRTIRVNIHDIPINCGKIFIFPLHLLAKFMQISN
jgi:galacturan 1,4-alpha-galacturonidase